MQFICTAHYGFHTFLWGAFSATVGQRIIDQYVARCSEWLQCYSGLTGLDHSSMRNLLVRCRQCYSELTTIAHYNSNALVIIPVG